MKKSGIVYLIILIQIAVKIEASSQQLRILTAGIRHESNTFSTILTREDDFKIAVGKDALNQPWAEELKKAGVEIIPSLHAYAWPGGVVEKKTFERFKSYILESIRNAGKLDGIYLDMHGALHVEGYQDAQLSLIRDIRLLVGNNILISGSFDLHGNLSPEFTNNLNIVTAFRTAPHRDGDITRVRAVKLLVTALQKKQKPVLAQIVIPLLIPGEQGITDIEPLKTIYEKLPLISRQEGISDASVFVGYAWADVPRASMSVIIVAENLSYLEKAREEAIKLSNEIWEARTRLHFEMTVGSADELIQMALHDSASTVFITDSGDNTTGGAAGDSPLFMERLLANKTCDAIFAGIFDTAAISICEKAGAGKTVDLVIGGKIDNVFAKPFQITAKVIFLSPEEIRKTDKRAAVVRVDGVDLVLLGTRRSFISPQDFYDVNIDPLDHKIVVVKLGYLYPELQDIAPRYMMALTPGFCYQILEDIDYKNIKRPVYPLDKSMIWQANAE